MQVGKKLQALRNKFKAKKPSKKNYSKEAMMMAKKEMMMK